MTYAEHLRLGCIEEVALSFRVSLQSEKYDQCAIAKAEVDRRINDGTIDLAGAIDAFRQPGLGWEVMYTEVYEGLFGRLKELHPERFTPEAALLYGVNLQLRMETAWPAYRSRK
jgi:hypothetical protein